MGLEEPAVSRSLDPEHRQDLFVSGGVVFAAGRVGTTADGLLDVFDLVCE